MDRNARKIASVRREIEGHFDFMLRRGFAITFADSSPEHFGNWAVDLRSHTCTMHVSNDRNFIGVELSPAGATGPHERISLDRLRDAVTDGAVAFAPFRGNLFWGQTKQLRRWARALEEKVDAVLRFFESNTRRPPQVDQ